MTNGVTPYTTPAVTDKSKNIDIKRDYVASGSLAWYPGAIRALPFGIDDITQDLSDDVYDHMCHDPTVAASVNALRAGILEDGAKFISAVTDKKADGYDLAQEIAAFCTSAMGDLAVPLDDVLWDMASAIALGNRVAEVIYGLVAGKLVITSIKVKPRTSTAFVVDPYMNVVGIAAVVPGQPWAVLTGMYFTDVNSTNVMPRDKFAVLTYRPRNNDPRGTALDPETPVPTPDGWRKMDDLQPGDKVFDEQGRIRYVVARKDWEDRPCYRLTFSDHSSIIADENHKWPTCLLWERSAKRPPKIRTTAEIAGNLKNTTNQCQHAIAWAAPLDYPEQILPVEPYYLGLWLGDGTSRSAHISCHVKDLEETMALIGASGYSAVAVKNGRSDNGRLIRVGGDEKWDSTGPSHALRLLGVQRDETGDNKHIPAAYLRGSIAQRRALLAGLMDSDGSVDRDGRCEFANTNYQLVEGVAELARSLGVPARVRVCQNARLSPDGYMRKEAWGAYFTPPWSPFRLERKTALTKKVRAQRWHYISNAEVVPNRRTVCIETDAPSHLYLAGTSMIPTHNSVLRPAYNAWNLKQIAWPEYLKYLVQFASPGIIGYTAENATNDENGVTPEIKLVNELVRWQNATALALKYGSKVDIVMSKGDGQAFLNAFQHFDRQIIHGILNQTLATMEGLHQSRAAAQTHQDVMDTLIRQGKMSVQWMILHDLIRPLVRYNYGDTALALAPTVTLGSGSNVDFAENAKAVAALIAAGGVRESQMSGIYEFLGLPPAITIDGPDMVDPVMGKPAPAATGTTDRQGQEAPPQDTTGGQ